MFDTHTEYQKLSAIGGPGDTEKVFKKISTCDKNYKVTCQSISGKTIATEHLKRVRDDETGKYYSFYILSNLADYPKGFLGNSNQNFKKDF